MSLKVALDAGHGHNRDGQPAGAHGNGIIEDDWARFFVERLAHYLRAAGATTIFTRETDAIVDLGRRAEIAREAQSDLFISIHLNASASEIGHGCEAFVVDGDVRPKPLATALLADIALAGMTNRGVKWDDQSQHSSLTVLRGTYRHMKSMLIEIGFLSNSQDAAKLKDNKWCEKLAATMAKTITTRS